MTARLVLTLFYALFAISGGLCGFLLTHDWHSALLVLPIMFGLGFICDFMRDHIKFSDEMKAIAARATRHLQTINWEPMQYTPPVVRPSQEWTNLYRSAYHHLHACPTCNGTGQKQRAA